MTVSIQYLKEIIQEPLDAGVENVFVAFIKLHQKPRPRTHGTRSTFFLFRQSPNIVLETQDWRLRSESWTTLPVEIIWSLYWLQITFFALFGLKVSSHFFLPSKPLFDARNVSHQYDLRDRLRKCYTVNLWSVTIARFINERFTGNKRKSGLKN